MRKFWIDIMEEGDGVRIEVGQGTEVTGFMSRTWDNNPNELPTYVAFAAWKNIWTNIQVDYEFCLNQQGKILVSPENVQSVSQKNGI